MTEFTIEFDDDWLPEDGELPERIVVEHWRDEMEAEYRRVDDGE